MSYVTRGRAQELEDMIEATERRLSSRLDELARDVGQAQLEARNARTLVLDLGRAGLGAMLDVYRGAVTELRNEPKGDG